MVFGFLVAWFIREVCIDTNQRRIICHFHEVLISLLLLLCSSDCCCYG